MSGMSQFGGLAGGFWRGFQEAQQMRINRQAADARMQAQMAAKYKGQQEQEAYNRGFGGGQGGASGGGASGGGPTSGGATARGASPSGAVMGGVASGGPPDAQSPAQPQNSAGFTDPGVWGPILNQTGGRSGHQAQQDVQAIPDTPSSSGAPSLRYGGKPTPPGAPARSATGAGPAGGGTPWSGSLSPDERDLMIRTVAGEAGGEGPQGQAAVAHVILNRTQDSRFGSNGVMGVIMAPNQFSTWDKGDPAGDMARRLSPDSAQYKAVGQIVDGATSGKIPDPTNGATNFYNPRGGNGTTYGAEGPAWAASTAAQNDVTIGNHRFTGKATFDLAPKTATASGGASGDNPKAPGALFAGDSRGVGMSMGRGGESIAVEGQSPGRVLAQLQGYQGSFKDRDIYLSPGTANLMTKDAQGNPVWDQKAFDQGNGLDNIKGQLDYIKGQGADMSRVHVLGVPQQYGGDHANDAVQDLAGGYGAQFHVLGDENLHPAPQAYNDVFKDATLAQTASNDQATNSTSPSAATPTAIPVPATPTSAGTDPVGQATPSVTPAPQPIAPPLVMDPPTPIAEPAVTMAGGDAFSHGGVVEGYADDGDVTDESNSDQDDQLQAIPADYSPQADQPAPDASDAEYVDPNVGVPNIMRAGYQAYGPNYDHPRFGQMRMPSSAPVGGRAPSVGRAPSMRSGGVGTAGDTINPLAPEISDDQGNLAPGALGAIQAGLQGIMSHFGLGQQGAIPGDQRTIQALNSFRDDPGLPPEQMHQIGAYTDPTSTLDGSMRNIAGLESVYRYAMSQGDVAGAQHWLGAMLMANKTATARFGGEGYDLLHKGDVEGACKALSKAYDCIPDGKSATATPNPDGTVAITRTNMQGNVVDQHTVTPGQMLGLATGLKNGTAYWQVLEQLAGETPKPAQQPMSPAAQQYLTALGGGQLPQPQAQAGGQLPQPQAQAGGQAPPKAQPASVDGLAIPPGGQTLTQQAIPDQPTAGATTPITPASATAPVTPPGNPQGTEEGAVPTEPTPLPTPGTPTDIASSLQDYSKFRAQALKAVGWQPQPPPQFTMPLPTNVTALEYQHMQAAQKQAFTEWKAGNDAREKQAEALATQWVAANRADATTDRQTQGETAKLVLQQHGETAKLVLQQQGETARMKDQEALQTKRDADTAYRTGLVENQKFIDGDNSGGDWAKEVIPKAFADKGDSPADATAKFASNFGDASDLLANAARDVAIHSGMNRAVGAQVVAGLVKPNPKSPTDLGFTFEQNAHDGFDVTFNSNGLTASVPKTTMTALMKLRLGVVQQMTQARASQSARDQTQGNTTDSFDRTGAVREPSSLTGIAQGQAATRQQDNSINVGDTPGAPVPMGAAIPDTPTTHNFARLTTPRKPQP